MAAKAFKKGQTVIHFSSYDGKGTFCWTRAVVKSCGDKQMTLLNKNTGEMMGCHFRPDADTTCITAFRGAQVVQNHTSFTLADMSDDEANAKCIKHAEIYLADKRAHFDECLTQDASEGYKAAIRKDIAELHDAVALQR